MRPNPYIVQTLKYATLTLLGVAVLLVSAALLRNNGSLTGRLVAPQQVGVIPTMKFDQDRAIAGFSVPTDTHVIFTIPEGVRIPRITFFGGEDYDLKRYWGYCFSGNEVENKKLGYLGKKMYDGQFFYSLGERQEQLKRPTVDDTDLNSILQSTTHKAAPELESIGEIFTGGQTCYVMSSVELPASVDTDGDTMNNKRETLLGLNPQNPDTDRDGIPDGTEFFKTKTDPKLNDTDRDWLYDKCEDKNMDGNLDKGETSPTVADTDRDGLCDGNGFGSGCPEPKQNYCFTNKDGDRECQSRPSTPVYGEDMNSNCLVDNGETDPRNPTTFGKADWDYKWDVLSRQTGNRQSDNAQGVDAPDFPIPDFPGQNDASQDEQAE